MKQTEAFRSIFEASLSDIAARTNPKERCLILSGGVDTCAILAAAKNIGMTFEAGFTVSAGEDSPDKKFATAAATEHDLPHHILHINTDELVSTYLPACVKLLDTFDGMTLRNSLVVAAVFRKVAEMGFKHAIVGDGADELFGGYSFMWGCADDPALWKEKRDSMCAKWTFATEVLATSYGLVSHSPYMEPKTVEWAIENTERMDCIGSHPICLVHVGEYLEHETGKMLLREAYSTVSSWRRKDPIEVGSGITVIGHDTYWKDIISDEEYKIEEAELLSRGFVIKNKEHLANFRAFQDYFGTNNGFTLPNKKRLSLGQGCAGCCFEIGDKTFCSVCGAFPAQRSS